MRRHGRQLRRVLALLTLLATLALAAPPSIAQGGGSPPAGDQLAVYRVYVSGPGDTARLVADGYDLLESRGPDYLLVVGDTATAERLRADGFRVSVDRTLTPIPGVARAAAGSTATGNATTVPATEPPPSVTPGPEAPPEGGPTTDTPATGDGSAPAPAPTDGAAAPPDAATATTFYGGYRTVDEHYAHLQSVAAAYPNLATVVDYGDSWRKVHDVAGGNDLLAICLTARQEGDCALSTNVVKPRTVIMAAIHARELQTSEIAYRLIDELTQKYGIDADLTMLMDTTEIWVIPVVNPDGREIVESGGNAPYLQRKNANNSLGACAVPPTATNHHGIDLNRNANFLWGTIGASSDPCAQTFKGTGPASEPEQIGLESLFNQLFPDEKGPGRADPASITTRGSFISLHSYGNLVLLPPGDGGVTPNDAQLRMLAFRMSHYNGYLTGTGPEVLYGTSGTTDDWIYGQLGVPGYTFEVSPNSGSCSGFTPAYTCIDSTLYPLNRNALLYAIRVSATPYITPAGPTITAVTLPVAVAPGPAVLVTATANDNALGTATGSVGRPAAQPVVAAEYYLDTAPWLAGTPVPMTAGDGAFDSTTETAAGTIATTGLTSGKHTVWVRAKDAGGTWGPYAARYFTIDPNAGATLLTDNFEAGAAAWSPLSGSAKWSVVADGTQRYQGSANKQSATGERVAGQASWTDYAVEVSTKTTTKRSTSRGPGVLARVVDADNHYRFAYTSAGAWAITKVVGGTVTQLATSPATPLAIDTNYVLRAEVKGSSLKLYVNGALVAQATDTALTTGRIGLRVYGSVTRFDDVMVTALP
ncbi:MAG: M14 family zinc carboxypeptidase [Acidimicrobiales bacterium]